MKNNKRMIKRLFLLTTLILLSFVCANAQDDHFLKLSVPAKQSTAAGIEVYSTSMQYEREKLKFEFVVKASVTTSLKVRVSGINSNEEYVTKTYTCKTDAATTQIGTEWTTVSFTTGGTFSIDSVFLQVGTLQGEMYITDMNVYDMSEGLVMLDEFDSTSDWTPTAKSKSLVSLKYISEAELSKTAIDKDVTLKVNGVSRKYHIYIPKNLASNPAVVFSLHGAGGSMGDNAPFKKEFAETNNVGCIVVYPQGLTQNFAVFGGSTPGWNSTGTVNEDINFFKAILSDITNQGVTSYDKNKVYICGFSNGGMETYAAASAAPDVFAAFASISGYQLNEFHQRLTGARPVPFMHIHGKSDSFVKYSLVGTIRDNMVARNGCVPVPVVTTGGNWTKSVYSATTGGYPYTFYEVTGMGHEAFTTVDTGASNEAMWYFFKNYSLDKDTSDKTLKWSLNPDYSGFEPAKHGWTVRDDNTGIRKYIYGDPTPSSSINNNVSHAIQFEKGTYQLRIESEGTSSRYIYVKLRKAGGEQVFCNRYAVGTKYYTQFDVAEFGEYTISITKTSKDDKIKSLGFYETTTAWTGAKAYSPNDYDDPVMEDVFLTLEQNDESCSKATMKKVGNSATFTTTGNSPEVIFKNLNVDVDRFNQVIIYFDGALKEDYLCAIGSNQTTIKAGATKYVYDIPTGIVNLSEIALISLNGTANNTLTVTGVALHNTRKSATEPAKPSAQQWYHLTASEFKSWTAADETGTVKGSAGCAYELEKSTGMPYGDGNVYYLNYADLSSATTLKVVASEGEPRILFNRVVDQGTVQVELPRDKADYETVEDNGDGTKTYTVDLAKIMSKYKFVHLHSIKGANWANTTVLSIVVDMETAGGIAEGDYGGGSGGSGDSSDDEPDFVGGTLIQLAQDQGKTLDTFGRATQVKGTNYTTYTSTADLTVAIKMFDVNVTNCDGFVIKFAEPVTSGWHMSFFKQGDNATVEIPAGTTTFEYKFSSGAVINNNILQQITLLNLWGATFPLTAKVEGIYLHSPNSKGDVNGDNKCDIADVTSLVNIATGKATKVPLADVNSDTVVNISDVTELVKTILGKK